MKPTLLLLTALAVCAPAFAEEKKSSAASSVIVNSNGDGTGKATITIEVNGKKEVREIDLGNATEIKVESDGGAKTKTASARKTYLGIAPDVLPEEVAAQLPLGEGEGVLVRSIVPGSPAEVAGLKKNDVLVRLDDQILTDGKQLQKLVGSKKAGETVRVVYFRGGQKNEANVKLAEHEGAKNETGFDLPNLDAIHNRLLKIDKKAVVIDREGNVFTKEPQAGDVVKKYEAVIREALPAEQVKKLQTQLDAMRKQIEAAQIQAAEAIEQAAKAAQKAAEVMKRESEPVEKK